MNPLHVSLFATIFVLASASLQAQAERGIDFGDNSSQWANDGECDDKRFSGAGMTSTILLDSDVGHDANDCREAYEQGRLEYLGQKSNSKPFKQARHHGNIDFGDDGSRWANDGECDDKRFSGDGMTSTTLLDSDIGHDATDCRTAYEQGQLRYIGR